MRKIIIKNEDGVLSLLDLLRAQGHYLPAYCGGRGSCGKCKAGMGQGAPPPTEEDIRLLTEEEIRQGWRLACRLHAIGEWEVELPDCSEEEIVAEALSCRDISFDDTGCTPVSPGDSQGYTPVSPADDQGYALDIDVGTTTLAAGLIRTKPGEEKRPEYTRTVTGVNHQRVFGTDVLSRIHAADQHKRIFSIDMFIWLVRVFLLCRSAERKRRKNENDGEQDRDESFHNVCSFLLKDTIIIMPKNGNVNLILIDRPRCVCYNK